MLKRRIIPKLLLREGRNVKGVRFENLRDVGHPVTNARIYDAQDADEILLLDILGTPESRKQLLGVIERLAAEIFTPLTVGGGVRAVDDVRQLLRAGADKVVINTAAVETPRLIHEAASRFGAQCIVASIDFRGEGGRARVFTHGARLRTEVEAVGHARRVAEAGAGEILLTSVDRDGTMQSYDLEVTRRAANAVGVPVIASGGAGTLQHLADALDDCLVSAVAVGSMFHFTDQSPIKARAFLRVHGVDVRT